MAEVNLDKSLADILSPPPEDLPLFVLITRNNPNATDFWRLSSYVQQLPQDILEKNTKSLVELFQQYSSRYLGCSFGLARLLIRIPSSPDLTKIQIPSDSRSASLLLCIFSQASLFFPDAYVLPLLDSPDSKVQRRTACVYAESHSMSAESVLQALESEDSQLWKTMNLYQSAHDKFLRKRGLLYIIAFLLPNGISSTGLLKVVLPLINHKPDGYYERECASEAQLIISSISSFEALHMEQILLSIIVQFDAGNISPIFLRAMIRVYGLSAIRKVLPKVAASDDRKISDVCAPYICFLGQDVQYSFIEALVTDCEQRSYDKSLFITTATAIASLSPIVSPFYGRFSVSLAQTGFEQEVRAILTPIVNPKGPAPLFQIKRVVIISEEDKRTQETQVVPDRKSEETQYIRFDEAEVPKKSAI